MTNYKQMSMDLSVIVTACLDFIGMVNSDERYVVRTVYDANRTRVYLASFRHPELEHQISLNCQELSGKPLEVVVAAALTAVCMMAVDDQIHNKEWYEAYAGDYIEGDAPVEVVDTDGVGGCDTSPD